MKQLILIRGLSGSGKTTLAETICGESESRIMVSADDFFINDDGEYSFDYTKLKEAHSWCQTETQEAMEDDYEVVVVHNTFTRKWEVDPYMKLAKDCGYQVQVINLYDGGLSDRQLSERCEHSISPHLIQKQRKRWDKDVYRERKHTPQHQGYYPPPPGYYPPPPQGYYHPQENRRPQGRFQKRGNNW